VVRYKDAAPGKEREVLDRIHVRVREFPLDVALTFGSPVIYAFSVAVWKEDL
jgi:hypothetical protein